MRNLCFKMCFLFFVFFAIGCKKGEKHLFVFQITGEDVFANDLKGKMGPGIEFELDKFDIPFEVEHEVYGSNLDYLISFTYPDKTKKFEVKVIIDGKEVAKKTEWDLSTAKPSMEISGKN